jgi:hypothetical protein
MFPRRHVTSRYESNDVDVSQTAKDLVAGSDLTFEDADHERMAR